MGRAKSAGLARVATGRNEKVVVLNPMGYPPRISPARTSKDRFLKRGPAGANHVQGKQAFRHPPGAARVDLPPPAAALSWPLATARRPAVT